MALTAPQKQIVVAFLSNLYTQGGIDLIAELVVKTKTQQTNDLKAYITQAKAERQSTLAGLDAAFNAQETQLNTEITALQAFFDTL